MTLWALLSSNGSSAADGLRRACMRGLAGGEGGNWLARPVDDGIIKMVPGPVSVGVVCPGEPSAAVVLVDVVGSLGLDVVLASLGGAPPPI